VGASEDTWVSVTLSVTQNTKITGSFGLDSILLTQGSRADLEVISLIIIGWPLFSNRGREGRPGLSALLVGVVACFRIYESDRR
jgi:hypothetical protein